MLHLKTGIRTAQFAFLILIYSLTPYLSAQDRVFPKQGVPVSGKFSSITPNQVVITVRGKDQTYAIHDIRKITFDNEPTSLDRARELALTNQFDQALEEVKKIGEADLSNPLIKQDVAFYRWFLEGQLALAGQGDKSNAIRGLLGVETANNNTHHMYALSETLGELAVAINEPEAAARYFGNMLKAPSDETKARGIYHLAETALAMDKPADAKVEFERVVSAPSSSPEMIRLKSLAEVGLAVCKNKAGESQAALDQLQSMIQKYDSTDQLLFARINNALGACYESLNKPKQALLRYLETDLLFFTDPDSHAEALYHISKLAPLAGEAAKAAEARESLVKLYAGSRWANK